MSIWGLQNESKVKNSGNGWYVVRLLGRYVVPTCVMEVWQVNRRALSYGMWKLERRHIGERWRKQGWCSKEFGLQVKVWEVIIWLGLKILTSHLGSLPLIFISNTLYMIKNVFYSDKTLNRGLMYNIKFLDCLHPNYFRFRVSIWLQSYIEIGFAKVYLE